MRVRIKFCGITRVEDALIAADLGVDAIGLILTRKSPRFIDLQQACEIKSALPPLVSAVALFMDDDPGWIEQVIGTLAPELLQFHGSETAGDCERYRSRYLKAVPMKKVENVKGFLDGYPGAAGFVFDSHAEGAAGGSGQSFDWLRVPANLARPWLLAGGLQAQNVAAAIEQLRPYGVDVSSGIESAPGIKDAATMRSFIHEVNRASRNPR